MCACGKPKQDSRNVLRKQQLKKLSFLSRNGMLNFGWEWELNFPISISTYFHLSFHQPKIHVLSKRISGLKNVVCIKVLPGGVAHLYKEYLRWSIGYLEALGLAARKRIIHQSGKSKKSILWFMALAVCLSKACFCQSINLFFLSPCFHWVTQWHKPMTPISRQIPEPGRRLNRCHS